MVCLLLLVSILSAAANNIALHKYAEVDCRKNSSLFQFLVSGLWALILLLLERNFKFSRTTLTFGLLYGVTMAMFLYYKMMALSTGPIAITSLVGSCSFLIPTFCGVFLWKEAVSPLQILGTGTLLISLILSSKMRGGSSVSKKWILCCVCFFCAAGINSILIAAFQKTESAPDTNLMLLIASVTAAVCYLLLFLTGSFRTSKREPLLPYLKAYLPKSLPYILICGLVSCCYQRLNLDLAGKLPSVLFFPVFNGGVILLSSVTGWVFFREKLTKLQIFGLISGFISILVIGNIIS